MFKTSNFYKGNAQLPKAGLEKEFSEEQIIEVAKCANDILYFGDNYFQLVHQEHGLIPMKLYEYQREAIKLYEETGKLLMNTARQVGKTSCITVIILHAALFNKHKNIAILANRKATAKEVLERIKLAYTNLPDFLKAGVKEWNKESIEFENGCKIFADASDANSIRGKSIFLLYIDEAAHVNDWASFSSAVLPTVTSNKNSRIVMTSTPKGLNHWYDYCEAARLEISDFKLIEVRWHDVDGRDEAWKKNALEELGNNMDLFRQEQECEFEGSSGTLISGAALKRMRHDNPIHEDNGLSMYENKVGNHQYVLIADTSRGKGRDNSAFHVIDITAEPFKQVCTYYNNMIEPTDYASVIDRIARYYNQAYVLIELNDLGKQVADLLYLSHEYDNLLMTENKGRSGKQISYSGKAERGITTTQPVRNTGCGMIKSIIEQNQLTIVDKNTIDELKVFSLKGNKYQAEQGKHDDLAMGLVLFGWLSAQEYFKELTDTDVMSRLREMSEEDIDDFLLGFGIVTDGTEDIMTDWNQPQEIAYDQFNDWMMN